MGFFQSDAGSSELEKALKAIQSVRGPTAAELTLPELQEYVAFGILTPQQYEAISANPDVYKQSIQETQDNSGSDAQKAALQQLGGIVQSGGSTPINEANLRNNINTTNQAMKASRSAIGQNAQERGVAGGGLEFISKLMDEQGNAEIANQGAVQAGANNAQLALQALTQQGSLGGQMQGQANQMSQAQADAARQIAEYNSQLQSQANQYNAQTANQAQQLNQANGQDISNKNTANANMRIQENAAIPQKMYDNSMGKASAIAGAYNNQAGNASRNAQGNNALTGNLIGTGARLVGAMYGGPVGAAGAGVAADKLTGKDPNDYAKGGEVKKPMDPKMATGQVPGVPALPGFGKAPRPADHLRQKLEAMIKNPTAMKSDEQREMDGETGPNLAHGGQVECYADGGEVHDHEICMEAGGPVPGDESEMPMGVDDESQDVVDAHLSPGEIVLPRSVTQSPDAPQQAEQFVQQTQGGGMPTASAGSFSEVLAKLAENGIELRLATKGM